jgi:Flp pilus assembly protein TadB
MGSATKTEDVMNVFNQLVQVREQIEVIKGQIKYYEESAALSSIAVDLVADEAVQPLEVGNWQVGGVVKDAIQALINTSRTLLKIVIWMVIYLLPVLVILFVIFGLPIWLIVRSARRRRARRQTVAPPPAEAPQS